MKKRTPHDSNGPEWAARKKTQTQDKSKSPHTGQVDPLPRALDRRGTNK